jgi:hypothetical protein
LMNFALASRMKVRLLPACLKRRFALNELLGSRKREHGISGIRDRQFDRGHL